MLRYLSHRPLGGSGMDLLCAHCSMRCRVGVPKHLVFAADGNTPAACLTAVRLEQVFHFGHGAGRASFRVRFTWINILST